MLVKKFKSLCKRIVTALTPEDQEATQHLATCQGIIHVGANSGQERFTYDKFGLNVVWIEPIPEIYEKLKSNVSGLEKHIAIQGLVTDENDKEYDFNVANNDGESSSIFDLKAHKEIWPTVNFEKKLTLRSRTLSRILHDNNIDLDRYDALALDTQGAELLVLRGAIDLLPRFKYINAEAADFEAYAGCCQLRDLQEFLSPYGFKLLRSKPFANAKGIGNYYDVLFSRPN